MTKASEKRWYLYMLHCVDGSLYTGITTDLARRVRQHLGLERGGARYTRTHAPVGIVAAWELASRSSASRAEFLVKRLSAAEKRTLVANPETLSAITGLEEPACPLGAEAVRELWPA